ncbi:MAG TPA: ATP-binding protein [Bacteroidota bacterium]
MGELTDLRRQYVNLKILEFEHQQALQALRESEERYRQIVETATDIIYRIDPRGYFTYANPVAVRIIGYSLNEIIGRNYLDIIQGYHRKRAMKHYLKQTKEKIPSTYFEFPAISKDGEVVWLGQNVELVMSGGEIVELQAVARDLTAARKAEKERKELELQLLQAQKMESIGRLAGGIAHDFNNILGIILAYADILNAEGLPREKFRTSLDAITRAVERAKGMVKELLTFARKTEPSFEYVDLNELIGGFMRMIMGTFPVNVVFSTNLDSANHGIMADPNQINQVLLNLFVNARDAMPKGGNLAVSTFPADESVLNKIHPHGPTLPHVCLEVHDTGIGMEPATISRIFEPFFSTKGHGVGSGLGLAVVYGIVQNHQGMINVESAPGKGATFRVYFPVADKKRKISTSGAPAHHLRGTETILFVEDEELLREGIVTALTSHGYRVLIAVDGVSAVEMFMREQHEIAVVLSDVGLPRLGGWEACVTMQEINPKIRIVMASGFIDPVVRAEMRRAGASFVQKPYEPAEILGKLREVLDSP